MTARLALVLALGLFATAATAQEVPGWDAEPYAATLALDHGFSDDPRTVDVRPGGSTANPLDGPGCVGYIAARPDVVIDYTASTWDLTFSAASETDINLVVRDPYGGYHCDDDSGEGLNPSLTIDGSASGRYTVWVGVFGSSGDIVDGVFGVSEVGNEVSLDGSVVEDDFGGEVPGWDAEPHAATLDLEAGFSNDPRTAAVRPGGSTANPLDGPGCVGYIASLPDVVVNYTASTWDLTFSAASETDINLVVRDPYGDYHCDDDSGEGLNPSLTIDGSASGRYTVWVGVFGSSGDIVDGIFGVSEVGNEVAADGSVVEGDGMIDEDDMGDVDVVTGGALAMGDVPGWDGEPYFGTSTLQAPFSGDPRTVDVRAGGTQANPLDGPGCVGYIATRPDHVLDYTAGSLSLTLSAAADGDLALVVRTPGGDYYCDDDSGEGLNPRVDFETPASGRYIIWVGTFADVEEYIDSTLAISELGIEATAD